MRKSSIDQPPPANLSVGLVAGEALAGAGVGPGVVPAELFDETALALPLISFPVSMLLSLLYPVAMIVSLLRVEAL